MILHHLLSVIEYPAVVVNTTSHTCPVTHAQWKAQQHEICKINEHLENQTEKLDGIMNLLGEQKFTLNNISDIQLEQIKSLLVIEKNLMTHDNKLNGLDESLAAHTSTLSDQNGKIDDIDTKLKEIYKEQSANVELTKEIYSNLNENGAQLGTMKSTLDEQSNSITEITNNLNIHDGRISHIENELSTMTHYTGQLMRNMKRQSEYMLRIQALSDGLAFKIDSLSKQLEICTVTGNTSSLKGNSYFTPISSIWLVYVTPSINHNKDIQVSFY